MASIPQLCHALGFYPSAGEVADMQRQLQYQAALAHQPQLTHLSLEQFIALYANYKPVGGTDMSQLEEAFRTLGAQPSTGV